MARISPIQSIISGIKYTYAELAHLDRAFSLLTPEITYYHLPIPAKIVDESAKQLIRIFSGNLDLHVNYRTLPHSPAEKLFAICFLTHTAYWDVDCWCVIGGAQSKLFVIQAFG